MPVTTDEQLEALANSKEPYVLVATNDLRWMLAELDRFKKWKDHVRSLHAQARSLVDDFSLDK